MFSDGKEIFRRYLTLGGHLKRQISKSIVKGERLNEAGVGGGGYNHSPFSIFRGDYLFILIFFKTVSNLFSSI